MKENEADFDRAVSIGVDNTGLGLAPPAQLPSSLPPIASVRSGAQPGSAREAARDSARGPEP